MRKLKLYKNNTSGYRGVYYILDTGKWAARIRKTPTRIYLGVFDTKEEAAAAYKIAFKFLFGEFARPYIAE